MSKVCVAKFLFSSRNLKLVGLTRGERADTADSLLSRPAGEEINRGPVFLQSYAHHILHSILHTGTNRLVLVE